MNIQCTLRKTYILSTFHTLKEPLYLQGYVRQFSNHYIRPDIIIVNLSRAKELYIDLYGTDNPHLRLLATITTVDVISDNCLITITASGETQRGGHP